MSDDAWRRRRRDDNDEDFGPPLFGDDPTGGVARHDAGLSFGNNDTGPLPHWSEEPTGEVPRLTPRQTDDAVEETDVWSSFNDDAPVWNDDPNELTAVQAAVDPAADHTGSSGLRRPADSSAGLDRSGGIGRSSDPSFTDSDATKRDPSEPVRREPGRITIGTDPTGGEARQAPGPRRQQSDPSRPQRRPAPSRKAPPSSGRDLPTAVAVGLAMAAVFVGAVMWKPVAVLVLVVLVLGLAAVEFFDKVAEKGYHPATYTGILACVAMPLAAWWQGLTGMVIVLFLAFAAICATFVAGRDIETNPMPNVAISTLGVVWIGFLGSFAAMILTASKLESGPFRHVGTDTLFLLVLGVVVNDIGAFFAGSTFGKTPLRSWISPNKTVEGFVGGTVFTLVAMVVVGMLGDKSSTWNSTGDLLLLGVVIAIAAPLGDLTESMFKRNLEIKDFGTLIKGHGGVLDRFDGFLFTLPAVYFLSITLQPWLTK
ncbi:MAG TPA: phosphatidate cytidylyltransferase [Ilumatobacteraceae bacterium]|nr:phosphatidate cytidylyltransferase [Ilumatobacteraceae bacterium]